MAAEYVQLGLGGLVALMILREVFGFLAKRKSELEAADGITSRTRPKSDKIRSVQDSVDAVLHRLDRIIEAVQDQNKETRAARRQSEITGEMCERVGRAVCGLEKTVERLTDTVATADK